MFWVRIISAWHVWLADDLTKIKSLGKAHHEPDINLIWIWKLVVVMVEMPGTVSSSLTWAALKSGLTLSWFMRSSVSVFTTDHLSPCRWVLCTNHTEPVKGFLGRFLRRKLIETEIDKNMRSNDLIKIIDWIPKTWQHLNGFLEAHSSSDVTIGQSHASTHTSTVHIHY